MILVDYSAISVAAIMIAVKRDDEIFSKDLVLHMVMNSLRNINVRFRKEYGEMILCCDGAYNWRKDVFEPYKHKRRKKRKEDTSIDWKILYEYLESIKDTIRDGFPYKVIEHKRAEADDVIGVLSRYSTDNEIKTVVVSNDKDFVQLVSKYVNQWKPMDESYVNISDPDVFLKELIIRGDSSDGIPNIKSPDDIFLQEGKRQKSIFKKDMEFWLKDDVCTFLNQDEEWKRNYARNRNLIDLRYTPQEIQEQIQHKYNTIETRISKQKMSTFFFANRLKRMHELINDFL